MDCDGSGYLGMMMRLQSRRRTIEKQDVDSLSLFHGNAAIAVDENEIDEPGLSIVNRKS